VQENAIKLGGKAEDLNRFSSLMNAAGHYELIKNKFESADKKHKDLLNDFNGYIKIRRDTIIQQREKMKKVSETVLKRFPERIRIRNEEDGINENLKSWISSLKDRGMTQWWNNQKEKQIITPNILLNALENSDFRDLKMSKTVSNAFTGLITDEKTLYLKSIRNDDRYVVEFNVDHQKGEENYREIEKLSGGAQVSVLLSLILKTDDSTPLVIDQPEDEIDKAYLFDNLIPALRGLKGRRQIIFVTHDANLVVNGDADQVLLLEADSENGEIKEQGAIEQPGVKNAIVHILDGGQRAFELRQVKYGF
jgi:hypothetical protein